jgi:hypothetical protein
MVWKAPQLPPVQKMPRQRPPAPPSYGGRIAAGAAGAVLLASAVIGIYRAVNSRVGASPFMALAPLLPAIVLIRYALTGKIKVS